MCVSMGVCVRLNMSIAGASVGVCVSPAPLAGVFGCLWIWERRVQGHLSPPAHACSEPEGVSEQSACRGRPRRVYMEQIPPSVSLQRLH